MEMENDSELEHLKARFREACGLPPETESQTPPALNSQRSKIHKGTTDMDVEKVGLNNITVAFSTFNNCLENSLLGGYGKLLSLWFDRIIVHSPTLEFVDVWLDRAVERFEIEKDTAYRLREFIYPIQMVIPAYEEPLNPFKHIDKTLGEAAMAVYSKYLDQNFPNADPAALIHELAHGIASFTKGILAWFALNAQFPCALLASNLEYKIAKDLLSKVLQRSDVDLSPSISKRRIVNLQEISWDAVIEFRMSSQWIRFRDRLNSTIQDLGDSNSKSVERQFEDIDFSDLYTIEDMQTTNARVDWQGLATNIPFPLYRGAPIKSMMQELTVGKHDRSFGALFFNLNSLTYSADNQSKSSRKSSVLRPEIRYIPVAAPRYDLFVSHAHEDKAFVRQLVAELERLGLKVWYDERCLEIGDSLRQAIDKGIIESRFGVVVLSEILFEKYWTQYELDSLGFVKK